MEQVHNFQYLGAWIDNTKADIKIRKELVYKACNKLTKMWKLTLPRSIKVILFRSTVGFLLLYAAEAWTLIKWLRKQLDRRYTKMLRTVTGVQWSQHVTNQDLYQDLPRLSETTTRRRLQFAGHCLNRENELGYNILLSQSRHGQRQRRKPQLTYMDTLTSDTGLQIEADRVA